MKIEKEKAKVDEDTTENAEREPCKANPQQLFKEVVTEIVDQRMKMEGNENKEEAGKGIPRLIESLKGKQINEKPPGGGRERKVQKPSKNDSMGKGKGQHISVNKTKVKAKYKLRERAKARTKAKAKGNHSKAKAKRVGKGKENKGKDKA